MSSIKFSVVLIVDCDLMLQVTRLFFTISVYYFGKALLIFNVVGSIFKAAVALSDVCYQEMLYKTLCVSITIRA